MSSARLCPGEGRRLKKAPGPKQSPEAFGDCFGAGLFFAPQLTSLWKHFSFPRAAVGKGHSVHKGHKGCIGGHKGVIGFIGVMGVRRGHRAACDGDEGDDDDGDGGQEDEGKEEGEDEEGRGRNKTGEG